MKTLKLSLSIIFAALMYGACSSDIESECHKTSVKLRSQSEAISIAENAYSVFNSGKDSRAGHETIASVSDVQVIRGRSSRGITNDTLLYIVNFENDEGYAVVSASPATEALFGITDEGHYDGNEESVNPSLRHYLDCASEYVASSNSTGITFPDSIVGPNIPHPNPENPTTIYDLLASKGPYVNLKWGQGSPYGDNFENGNCGCFISVVAMIALTTHWPGDLDRYGILSSHIGNGEGCSEHREDVHFQIACAMRNMANPFNYECLLDETVYSIPRDYDFRIYLPSATGQCFYVRPCSNVSQVLIHLDDYETQEEKSALLFATTGNTNDDYSRIGHCWLIDGYKQVRFRRFGQNQYLVETYLHCNWAYDGNGNGYFLPTSNFRTVLCNEVQGSNPVQLSDNDKVIYHLVKRSLLTGSNKREK